MKEWHRKLIILLSITLGVYLFVLANLYFLQEKMLFHPEILAKDYKFNFKGQFEEIYIPVDGSVKLHGVLFKCKNPKGLVFYLHGNGGSVGGRGNGSEDYTKLGYDLFILDYRGYGKSGGLVKNEEQLVSDVKKAYDYMLRNYNFTDESTIIAGYSIGTGPAAILAENKNIKALILQAPYYSLTKLIDEKVPMVPEFIKRYKLNTYKSILRIKAPIYIYHGLDDRLIPYKNSEDLKKLNPKINLIPLPGMKHNGINENIIFKTSLKTILTGK